MNSEAFQISESFSSNFAQEPFLIGTSNAYHLVAYFTGALAGLATQSKASLGIVFFDFETTKNSKLRSILKELAKFYNQRKRARKTNRRQLDCDNGVSRSTQTLKNRKNQRFFAALLGRLFKSFICVWLQQCKR